MRSRVGTWVITLGAAGVRVEQRGRAADHRGRGARDPRGWSRPASATRSAPATSPRSPGASAAERAAQLGCLLAVHVVEQVGTQEYTLSREAFLRRCAAAYGDDAAADARAAPAHVPPLSPTGRGAQVARRTAVARGAVGGGVLAEVAPGRSSGTTRRRRPGRPGRSRPPRPRPPTGTSTTRRASSITGCGQTSPRPSSSRSTASARRSPAHLGAQVGDDAGQHGQEPLDVVGGRGRGSARPARCRGSARPSPPARGWARASRPCRPSRWPRRSRDGRARSRAPRRRRTGRRT